LNQKIYCRDIDKTFTLDVSQQQLWNRQWQTLAENRQCTSFLSVANSLLIQQGGMNPGNTSLVNQTVIYEANTNAWKAGSSYIDPVTGANRQM
jgi:hypothetical protein